MNLNLLNALYKVLLLMAILLLTIFIMQNCKRLSNVDKNVNIIAEQLQIDIIEIN